MTETARIFVGSDLKQGKAELALEHSVRKHASIPVEIIFMRAGEGFWKDWAINWQFRQEKAGAGWHHTQFTTFRYGIPGYTDYQGKAIYMDSDQIMLRDVAELWNQPMAAPWKCVATKRTCVSLINCAPFKDARWWPRLDDIKSVNRPGVYYRDLMSRNHFMDPTLSEHWNCADGAGFHPEKTGIVHFTSVYSQPWKPHEGLPGFVYREHRHPKMAKLWQQYYDEAVASMSDGAA